MDATYRDEEGNEIDLAGDSIDALAAQLPENYAGPRLEIRDEQDCIRGWIGGRNDWRAQ